MTKVTTLGIILMHHSVPGMKNGKYTKPGFAGAVCIKQGLLTKPRLVGFAQCLSGRDIHLLCCYNHKVIDSLIVYQPCYPFIGFHVGPAKTENNRDISMVPQINKSEALRKWTY